VRAAIARGGAYLARQVQKDGRFCYAYHVDTDRCDPTYSQPRHAGTAYAMFSVQRVAPDPQVVAAAERAMGWLRRQVRYAGPDRAYLVEGDAAKLGSTALALLAFVERERVVRDGRDRALMTRLADFLISQQRENGDFASYFDWGPKARVPEDRSIYYPGEALLALIRLYGLDPQPRYLESALRAAAYLTAERWRWAGAEVYVPPDAWLVQALAELDALAPDERRRAYAYEIVHVIEMSQLSTDEGAPPDLDGAPLTGGRDLPSTTATGSRSELTGSAWRLALATGEGDPAAAIRALALRAARFQLAMQFRPENEWWAAAPQRADGGLRDRPDQPEVRIDTVQHNLSGLLDVYGMLQ
jgi:hypothetical protein